MRPSPSCRLRFRWSVNFRSVDTRTVDDDPDVADDIQRYLLSLPKELDQRIGVADTDIDLRDVVVRAVEIAVLRRSWQTPCKRPSAPTRPSSMPARMRADVVISCVERRSRGDQS